MAKLFHNTFKNYHNTNVFNTNLSIKLAKQLQSLIKAMHAIQRAEDEEILREIRNNV